MKTWFKKLKEYKPFEELKRLQQYSQGDEMDYFKSYALILNYARYMTDYVVNESKNWVNLMPTFTAAKINK